MFNAIHGGLGGRASSTSRKKGHRASNRTVTVAKSWKILGCPLSKLRFL